ALDHDRQAVRLKVAIPARDEQRLRYRYRDRALAGRGIGRDRKSRRPGRDAVDDVAAVRADVAGADRSVFAQDRHLAGRQGLSAERHKADDRAAAADPDRAAKQEQTDQRAREQHARDRATSAWSGTGPE